MACLQAHSEHTVRAVVVDDEHATAATWRGLPLVPWSALPGRFGPDDHEAFVAVGYHDMNRLRLSRMEMLRALGYRLISHVGPGGWGDVEVGENVFVMEGRSLQPGVRLGDGATVFAGANVGHHSVVGAGAWITSGVSIGGHAELGDRVFLGLGATIGHRVVLGEGAFGGAGAVVPRSIGPNEVHLAAAAQKGALDADRFLRFMVR